MDVDEVIREIQADGRIEGVTCSGGEPFAQADALAAILGGLQTPECGTIVFSGYRLEHLMRRSQHDVAIAKALAQIDVLIDGVYLEEKNKSRSTMRGSDNQRVHYLTERYKGEHAYFDGYDRDAFEMRATNFGDTMLVGVPSRRAVDVWTILAPSKGEVSQ